MAGFRPRSLTGDYNKDLPALTEVLEELTRGLRNAHIAPTAAIGFTKLNVVDLGTVDVTGSEIRVRHTLGTAPVFVGLTPQSNVTVWESRRRDRQFIYLTASGAGSVAVLVGA